MDDYTDLHVEVGLQNRVLNLTKELGLSHISSTLPACNILGHIYANKNPKDKVVLSNGHAGLALYCVLEREYELDAKELVQRHGIHPNRNIEDFIHCSTGSLGAGITVAIGMALGDPRRNIHCVISDGECAEGSVWEALRFAEDSKLRNIYFYVQSNSYGAYSRVDTSKLVERLNAFNRNVYVYHTDTSFGITEDPYYYHYKKIDDTEYSKLQEIINARSIQTKLINRDS
jgi:transketolase N-terminal domain/subunit